MWGAADDAVLGPAHAGVGAHEESPVPDAPAVTAMISMWRGPTGPCIGIGEAVEYVQSVRGRVEIYLEPRDIWIGVYVAQKGPVYICPLPCLVFRFSRGRRIAR